MGSAYGDWNRNREEHTAARRAAGRARRAGKVSLGKREQRRLAQLAVCIVLFLVVLIGKGVFPEQLAETRSKLTAILGMDTDFQAAFSNFGHAISEGEPILETLGGFWTDIFGGGKAEVFYVRTVTGSDAYEAERTFVAQPLTAGRILSHRFGVEEGGEGPAVLPPQPTPALTPEPTPVPEPEPTPEPAVIHMEYDGPELPDNASMDKYALGIETMLPIQGAEGWWVSSGFGWRENPKGDGDDFHNGVDLAVNYGTPIKAFADGVVDYIGEGPSYGLYTQIRHDNGVTSFYAHCSKLLVRKGQTVSMGDVIAQSGDTGNVTGPHLHFEMRKDGILINPLYYLETV